MRLLLEDVSPEPRGRKQTRSWGKCLSGARGRAAARRGPGHWQAGSRSGGWIADRPCLVAASSPNGAPPFRILPAAGGCVVVTGRALSRCARSANPVAPLFLFDDTEERNHAKPKSPENYRRNPCRSAISIWLRGPAHRQGNANSAARSQIVISPPPMTLHPPRSSCALTLVCAPRSSATRRRARSPGTTLPALRTSAPPPPRATIHTRVAAS